MKELTIGPNDSGQRLDKFMSKAFPALPQSLLYKYIRLKRVKVNGRRVDSGYKLERGDHLEFYINDELLAAPDAVQAWRKASSDITVVFEDDHVLLVDKPQGLLCHEDDREAVNTLINRIKAYLHESGHWRPEDENSFVPALCNRIDRNTSGLVIAAKTAQALRVINRQIKERQVEKRYLCLVHGQPPKGGTLLGYIRRDLDQKQVTVLDHPAPGALTAQTEFRVLESRGGLSLLECHLLTGRTHQIRAQMAHAGFPLVGDTKYGTAGINAGLPFRHQALHSYKVTFGRTGDWEGLGYLCGQSFETGQPTFMAFFKNLGKK